MRPSVSMMTHKHAVLQCKILIAKKSCLTGKKQIGEICFS